jgi:hypothetical protein
VVQMAKAKYDRREYAIKFFVSNQAFESEKALYSCDGAHASALAQFLPNVRSFVSSSFLK